MADAGLSTCLRRLPPAPPSFAFGPDGWSVGASGAIFGLFGVVLVATRFHHAILDAQSRAIAAQVGILIVINLVIGFSGLLNVDNYAHVGGLLAGLWLGLILPPGQVATLASMWQSPGGGRSPAVTLALRSRRRGGAAGGRRDRHRRRDQPLAGRPRLPAAVRRP